MDWIKTALFSALKALYVEPIIHSCCIHTGGDGKLHA